VNFRLAVAGATRSIAGNFRYGSDLARSLDGPGMTATCAFRPTGIDVLRT
jgi:hypothetical protein